MGILIIRRLLCYASIPVALCLGGCGAATRTKAVASTNPSPSADRSSQAARSAPVIDLTPGASGDAVLHTVVGTTAQQVPVYQSVGRGPVAVPVSRGTGTGHVRARVPDAGKIVVAVNCRGDKQLKLFDGKRLLMVVGPCDGRVVFQNTFATAGLTSGWWTVKTGGGTSWTLAAIGERGQRSAHGISSNGA